MIELINFHDIPTIAAMQQLHCLENKCDTVHQCFITLHCDCEHVLCEHDHDHDDSHSTAPFYQAEHSCEGHDHNETSFGAGNSNEVISVFSDYYKETSRHCPNCSSHLVGLGYCKNCRSTFLD